MQKVLIAFTALAALLCAAPCWGQPETELRPQRTVFLYASAAPEMADPVVGKELEFAGFEMAESNGVEEPERIGANGNLHNVSGLARFDLYFPENPNGQMVLIFPGGGYVGMTTYLGGLYVAEYLVNRGITAAVVKYRKPNRHPDVPLADVQNVMRYCRVHADEWGVRQIGVWGMSAGGHLAASAQTMYTDAVTRPDFAVLIYPVISFDRRYAPDSNTRRYMIGYEEGSDAFAEKYSADMHVTPDTPPAFIALSENDRSVPPAQGILMFTRLMENGVRADLHIYPKGGHGWSVIPRTDGRERFSEYRAEFLQSVERFLAQMNNNNNK